MNNKTIKLMTLLAVLSTMAVSCQKDNIDSAMPANVVNNVHSVYIYQYEVNGVRSRITLRSEYDRIFFINRMFALAEKGYQVSFFDETRTAQLFSKETVVYSTKDKNKALAWSRNMVDNGYEVIITYNEETGYYDCTAIK